MRVLSGGHASVCLACSDLVERMVDVGRAALDWYAPLSPFVRRASLFLCILFTNGNILDGQSVSVSSRLIFTVLIYR